MRNLFKKYSEKRLIIYLVVFYSFIALVEFLRGSYFLYSGPQRVTDDLVGLALVCFIDWAFVLLFMCSVSLLTKYLLLKRVAWTKIIPLHIVLSIIQSYMVGFIPPMIMDYSMINADFAFLDKVTHTFFFNVTTNILLYSSMTLIIYAYFYLQQIKDQEIRNKVLENSLIKFKLKTLESQLNPHFLFNTLNSISSLIPNNPDAAQDMVADISFLLRKFLSIDDKNFITVREELEILDYYTNILKQRFQEDLVITKKIEESLLNKQIPRLLIQPIIENSIKHGFSQKNKKLRIHLCIAKNEDSIELSVENNGKKLPKYPIYSNSGIGIINIKERLQALYHGKSDFHFENMSNGVRTVITIPYN